MTHFVTLTVPSPRTNHILSQHRQGRSPGQTVSNFMTLQKTSVSGHFRELHTIFGTRVNFFRNLLDFYQILVDDIL
jgi:hypothetical protein